MSSCPDFRATLSSASTGKARIRTPRSGVNITESDWAVMERHAVAVLDKFGIQGREREDFLGAAASLKADIVQG